MPLVDCIKMVVGSPAGSFGIVVGALFLVFWVYGKFLKIIHEHGTFEKRCDKMEKDVEQIKCDLIYIKGMINQLTNRNGKDEMMQAHSPLSLTEKGKTTADGMNARTIIATNWESTILPKMEAELVGKNPYDIQQYCLERVPVSPEAFITQKDLDAIKLYAFKMGHPLFTCLKVLGLMIRDEYLKAHQIAIEDIDRHDPEKQG